MRKFLSILLLVLGFVYTGRAELNVEWIDENTIVVTGYGYGNVTNETALGSCTNCLNISPAEMRAIKMDILSNVDIALQDCDTVLRYSSFIQDICNGELSGISGFRRFTEIPHVQGSTTSQFQSFTNYVYSEENAQTTLDRANRPTSGASQAATRNSWIGYNNGIYDYATQYASPYLNGILGDAEQIERTTLDIKSSLGVISNTVVSITEESCQSCGGGSSTNGTSCTSCPCEEQWEALLDYVRHIDDDQHKRHVQLHDISNRVSNLDKSFDSYAKLVSGILYQDATIVVDDGENSWSNVYNTGHSDLYDYDKSNILQRIELLLYGLVSNTSTNWGSATSDVSSDVSDMQDNIDDVKSSVADANTEYTSEVNTISQKITALFNALNFFGAGSLGNFSYGEPMQFDVYDFQFDFTNAADFRPLQQVCRTAMQVFYWTAGVVFMLVFWYRVVKFTTDFALRIIHFFNNLLT